MRRRRRRRYCNAPVVDFSPHVQQRDQTRLCLCAAVRYAMLFEHIYVQVGATSCAEPRTASPARCSVRILVPLALALSISLSLRTRRARTAQHVGLFLYAHARAHCAHNTHTHTRAYERNEMCASIADCAHGYERASESECVRVRLFFTRTPRSPASQALTPTKHIIIGFRIHSNQNGFRHEATRTHHRHHQHSRAHFTDSDSITCFCARKNTASQTRRRRQSLHIKNHHTRALEYLQPTCTRRPVQTCRRWNIRSNNSRCSIHSSRNNSRCNNSRCNNSRSNSISSSSCSISSTTILPTARFRSSLYNRISHNFPPHRRPSRPPSTATRGRSSVISGSPTTSHHPQSIRGMCPILLQTSFLWFSPWICAHRFPPIFPPDSQCITTGSYLRVYSEKPVR